VLSTESMGDIQLRLIDYPVQITPADPAQAVSARRDVEHGNLIIVIALGLASGLELGPLVNAAAGLGRYSLNHRESHTAARAAG